MTFDRTWVLFFLALPLMWAAFEWTRTSRRMALLLKALCFIAIILALAEPNLTLNESKLAVAVLVDTSASASDADLKRASDLAEKLTDSHGRNWMKVIPFARTTRNLSKTEKS